MRVFYPVRKRRRLRGLGYPVLPDNFTTAAGVPESFSPQTADATVISILQSQGQQLPADLAAKWAAAQSGTTTPAASTPAVTASGTPVSTQTGAAITLMSTIAVAPGVWKCVMSDGTSHYCDQNQNPISYTPPPVPVATPATSSQPTAVVAPAVTPVPTTTPATTPVAVTPSGAPISTTTGTPTSATVVSTVESSLSSLMTWLEGSMIGGIPNWLLVGGVVAGLMMFGGDGGSHRRR